MVDFTLYLHALDWRGLAIGMVLSGSGLLGAALSLAVGVGSDRLRRKPFLLGYEVISLVCGMAVVFSAEPLILSIAAITGGFGRGASGAAGPFSPVEQAWLAEEVPPERRGWVYSLNTGMGHWGMGVGAGLAILPSLWGSWFSPEALAYRPLFALVGLSAAVNLLLIGGAREKYREAAPTASPQEQELQAQSRKWENQILAKLALINSFNGLAIGLTGPLISYWFALRFHVGPLYIAPVMAGTFLITGIVSLLTGWLTQRIGIVSSVVWERMIGMGMMAILPLMPNYWLASLVYLLRSVFSRGSAGAQQALTVGLVREERSGLAASLNAISFQLPRSVGPGISGYLLGAGQFSLPFYSAALLQGIYLVWYWKTFRLYEPSGKGPGKSVRPHETIGDRLEDWH